jgi:hypothetical protein
MGATGPQGPTGLLGDSLAYHVQLLTGGWIRAGDDNNGVLFGHLTGVWGTGMGIVSRSSGVNAVQILQGGYIRVRGIIEATSGIIDGVLTIGTSGGIYQGTGTFSSPQTGLKIWNDSGIGRLATYNSGTAQVYFGTDGKLYAGAGKVWLDSAGLNISALTNVGQINFYDGGTLCSTISNPLVSYQQTLLLQVNPVPNRHSYCKIDVRSSSGYDAVFHAVAKHESPGGLMAYLELHSTGSTSFAYLLCQELIYSCNLRPLRSGTTYTGYIYVPLITALTHSSLDGDALNVGTYTIGPTGSGANFEFSYPSAARALAVRLVGKWAAASDGYYCYMRPAGSGAHAQLMVRSLVANVYNDSSGVVATNTNGQVELVVGGANMTNVWVVITGYFL